MSPAEPALFLRLAWLRRQLRRRAALLITTATVCVVGGLFPEPLHHWEISLTGISQELRGQRPVRSPVTIVAIDDYSLQQLDNADLTGDRLLESVDQWPWPRRVHAMVLDRLFAAGARAVALDLVFDTYSNHGPADDAALAAALGRHGSRTVLGAMVTESRGTVAQLALSTPISTLLSGGSSRPALGLLDVRSEADGSIRRRPGDYAKHMQRILGETVPAGISTSLLQSAHAVDRSHAPLPIGQWLPLLDPYGPPRSVPTLSIWQLLDTSSYRKLLKSGLLRNQLVLVGPTASVFQDIHQTPFAGSEGTSGVELHATELANRLEGGTLWLWSPGRWWWIGGLGVLVLGSGLISERWERPLQRFAALAGLALALVLAGQIAITCFGLAPNMFTAAAAVLLIGVVSSGEATVRLQWQRWRLRQALGRYLSPAVATEIANQPAAADGLLGGRSMDVVILLSDIRGFTSRTRAMTEAGKVPELMQQLNTYFSEVVEAVHAEGGAVDKFIGDATLAVFGVPYSRGDRLEAEAALRAAQEILRRLSSLNQRWQQEGKDPWQQVVILNFGTVISGNVGSKQRMDYTVIGDAVNATSRLESVAKECGRDLIMSHAFVEQLTVSLPLEPLGMFELRGHGSELVYTLQDTDSAIQGSGL
ncbi:MAG: CHASE2 domain-containing protein [Synechococcaceae cyanobacterium]